MPEHPNPKLRTPDPPATPARSTYDYAELDVVTNFSFLRGASHPDELVNRAAELGHRAIAITDINSLAGVVRAHEAARKVGLKILIGSHLTFADGSPDLLVYPADRPAYARLCRLLTTGKRRTAKGECELYLEDFLEHHEGLLAAVLAPSEGIEGMRNDKCSNERTRASNAKNVNPLSHPSFRNSSPIPHSPLSLLRQTLGTRLSLATSCLYGPDDVTRLQHLLDISRQFDIPLLATNGVHYHDLSRRPLQDILTCIRHGCTIQQAGFRLFPNGERYLKSPAQMHRLFRDHPQAIHRTIAIAEQCTFKLDELKYDYPDEIVPAGRTPMQHLHQISWEGAATRYPAGIPEKVRELLTYELKLIEQLQFEAYFLTVYDLVCFARSRGILCQGRGSAANSAVCYCLGVTSVDPAEINVLFERFISAARNEPPDIDIDFEHERREEVIQYLYDKYGRERAGMTAEVITYRGRSAVRDVGKALGLSLDLVDQMAKRLDWWHRGTLNADQLREIGLDPADRTVQMVVGLTGELLGFPRHLSQHVGGMVMTRGPLCEMVPIENASMPDRTVIEWDKNDIDAVGILKVDALALGMLTCISKAFKLIEGLRDQGTKGLREQEAQGERLSSRTNIQGSDCMATRDGSGPSDLPHDSRNAGEREVRISKPDVESGVFCSIEHSRGICEGESAGLPKISSHCQGLARRTCNSIRVGNQLENHQSDLSDFPSSRRGRTDSPIPDHKLGTENPRGECDKEGLARKTPELSNTASPLSPSVPESLSPSSSRLELHTIPPNDPATYNMICNADTIGVFQIESRAQMTMLPRLRPKNFYDLVIEVAIVRPGPIQGNMVHPYLRRRNSEEPVTYPSKELESVLTKTLGVPLFQEQAMRVAMVGAGFSADEADKLRRAMASWRRNGALETFHEKIVRGMLANGYTAEFAEQSWLQIRGFGEYGFPESHSAAFALLVYVSAWLKCHHPAAFAAALLNSQPMGFYAPAQIVRDARDHGVEVRPVDVNCSEWDCTLESDDEDGEWKMEDGANARAPSSILNPPSSPQPSLRLGFRQIKGLPEAHAQSIVAARARCSRFTSIPQFHRATALPCHTLRRLAEADAFSSLGLSRRQAIWQVLAIRDADMPLFDRATTSSPESSGVTDVSPTSASQHQNNLDAEPQVDLPLMPLNQEVMIDYRTAGLSLKQHPMALLRLQLSKLRIITSAELQHMSAGQWVKTAGLVLIRQRPGTASGIVFETLEDETGIVNVIIRPDLYDRHRAAARHAALLQAEGYIERQGQVMHIMAKRLTDLSHLLPGYILSSRDFH